jgi:hypothetical protein
MLLHEGAWILWMKLHAFSIQVTSSLVEYIFSFQEIYDHVVAVWVQTPCSLVLGYKYYGETSPKRC